MFDKSAPLGRLNIMKDPGVDGCLPLVTQNCLSLARSARVRATESKSGCSHRACGNRHARDRVGEGRGGDMGVEGWEEKEHWGGCTPFC